MHNACCFLGIIHSDDGDDDGDNVDFEDTDSNRSSDFQGKNDSKASESEVICTNSDSDITLVIGYSLTHQCGTDL